MFKAKEKKKEAVLDRFEDFDLSYNKPQTPPSQVLSNENSVQDFGSHFVPCEYVGTFAVLYGDKDMSTIKTHKARVKFVKDRLANFKSTKKTVPVVIMITLNGIKVLSTDKKKVKMAHALLRVSYSTCDPVKKLFAIMTHCPNPQDVNVYCHFFVTKSSDEAQWLNVLVGKAFHTAFATTSNTTEHDIQESQVPKPYTPPLHPAKPHGSPSQETDHSSTQIKSENKREPAPAKRWAKHEVLRGHSKGEHALKAQLKKKNEVSETERKKQIEIANKNAVETAVKTDKRVDKKVTQSGTNQESASQSSANQKINNGVDKQETQSRTNQELASQSSANQKIDVLSNASQGALNKTSQLDSSIDSSQINKAENIIEKVTMVTGIDHRRTPPTQRKEWQQFVADFTDSDNQVIQQTEQKQRSDLSPPLPPKNKLSSQDPLQGNRPLTPPMNSTQVETNEIKGLKDKQSDIVLKDNSKIIPTPLNNGYGSASKENEENTSPEFSKKCFDSNNDESDQSSGDGGETFGYQRESWYLANISREMVMELLSKSDEGAFFVRDSQSQPGCLVLSVRVPYEANQSGIGNYLIIKQPIGIMIKGFDNIFPDISTLIQYHSEQADGLPCKLALAKNNPFIDSDEEYQTPYGQYDEPLDRDYIDLSDYHSIFDELSINS